jgi:hypothetical protein
LKRRLPEPQSRSGRFREENNLLLLPEFEPRTVQPEAIASLYEEEKIIASFNGIHSDML